MIRTNRNSVLVAGVPRSRGTPVHIEHDDDTAQTMIVGSKVTEVHTPQRPFERIHEFMHMKHTNSPKMERAFRRVEWIVGQIVEDCRLHMLHWPWKIRHTPKLIIADVRRHLDEERGRIDNARKLNPKLAGSWQDFAPRVRQLAICEGAGFIADPFEPYYFADGSQAHLSHKILKLIREGHEKVAAEMLQMAFFGALIPVRPSGKGGMRIRGDILSASDGESLYDGWGIDIDARSGKRETVYFDDEPVNPPMDIIELPHEIRINDAKVGRRRTTMGPRLHRPSLRKVILPQRIFTKRARIEPGGTILIDASGSMGGWENVSKWLEEAPFSTVAYYAGHGARGQLFVYARKGRRAAQFAEPDGGDNTVDGPAINWLMKERAPRIMVTDRGFCGAADSEAQVLRLATLEAAGEIEVRDYSHQSD